MTVVTVTSVVVSVDVTTSGVLENKLVPNHVPTDTMTFYRLTLSQSQCLW